MRRLFTRIADASEILYTTTIAVSGVALETEAGKEGHFKTSFSEIRDTIPHFGAGIVPGFRARLDSASYAYKEKDHF